MGPIPQAKTTSTASAPSATISNPATTHTQDPDAAAPSPSAATTTPSKRKRTEKTPHILHQATLRNPPWTYFHLTLLTPTTATTTSSESPPLDALTVSTLLLQPLTSYLGTTGAAIPIDILHTRGRSAWIRVPRRDARAFRAGVSGWVGGSEGEKVAWRVEEGGSLGVVKGEEKIGERGAAY